MIELMEELAKEFKQSIPENIQREKLTGEYEKMLKQVVESFKNINCQDSEIEKTLIKIGKEWIDLDIEEKQRRLLRDENFQDIVRDSTRIYNIAISILEKEEVNIEFDISEKEKQLEEKLKNVKTFNKLEAEKLVSEAILDLKFIENPNTNIVSLRLGHIKYNIKEGEER